MPAYTGLRTTRHVPAPSTNFYIQSVVRTCASPAKQGAEKRQGRVRGAGGVGRGHFGMQGVGRPADNRAGLRAASRGASRTLRVAFRSGWLNRSRLSGEIPQRYHTCLVGGRGEESPLLRGQQLLLLCVLGASLAVQRTPHGGFDKMFFFSGYHTTLTGPAPPTFNSRISWYRMDFPVSFLCARSC